MGSVADGARRGARAKRDPSDRVAHPASAVAPGIVSHTAAQWSLGETGAGALLLALLPALAGAAFGGVAEGLAPPLLDRGTADIVVLYVLIEAFRALQLELAASIVVLRPRTSTCADARHRSRCAGDAARVQML